MMRRDEEEKKEDEKRFAVEVRKGTKKIYRSSNRIEPWKCDKKDTSESFRW